MDSAKYARHIGRVGALAVALGVGAAVATGYGAGVAMADDTASDTGSASADAPSKSAEKVSAQRGDAQGSVDDDETISESDVDGSDLQDDPATDEDQSSVEDVDEDADAEEDIDADVNLDVPDVTDEAHVDPSDVAGEPAADLESAQQGDAVQHDSGTQSSPRRPSVSDEDGADGPDEDIDDDEPLAVPVTDDESARVEVHSQNARLVPNSAEESAVRADAAPEQPEAETVVGDATTVVGLLLSPFLAPGGPAAPAEPPMLWAVLAFVRREIQRAFFNHTPDATDISESIDENTPLVIDLVDGVTDAEGDPVTVTSFTQPAPEAGVVTQNPDGTLTYIPAADFTGQATLTYTVRDRGFNLVTDVWRVLTGQGPRTDTATVTITVNAVAEAPVAGHDEFSGDEDTVISGNVLDNDTDEDGEPLSVVVGDKPAHGEVVLNADGSFTYTPNAGFAGEDTFSYTVSDGVLTDTAAVKITVTAVADAPVAQGDTYVIDEDTVISGNVLTNDSDEDGDALSVVVDAVPAHGDVVLNADGSFTYKPFTGFAGEDSFSYTVSDGALTDTATVTITVNSVNSAPVAQGDEFSGEEDTVISGNVLANDSDQDGDPLSVVLGDKPTHGEVLLNEDGSFTYTPDADFAGADEFTYSVTDGEKVSVGYVKIHVIEVPDVAVVDTVDIGVRPVDVSVTPDGDYIYLVDSEDGTITLVEKDRDGWKFVDTYTVDVTPDRVVTDLETAYVLDREAGKVVLLDISDGIPVKLGVDPTTGEADPFVVEDLADIAVTKEALLGVKYAFYGVDSAGRLSVYDPIARQQLAFVDTFDVATEARALAAASSVARRPSVVASLNGIVYVAAGGRLAVVQNTRNAVALRAADGTVEVEVQLTVREDLDVSGDITKVAVSADGERLLLTVLRDGKSQLDVYDTTGETLTKLGAVDVVANANGIAISDDRTQAYVIGEGDKMSLVNLEKDEPRLAEEVHLGVATAVVAVPGLAAVLVAIPAEGKLAVVGEPAAGDPVAGDDAATTGEDNSVLIDVLANDVDPEGGATLTTVIGEQATNGIATVNADGTISYTPAPDFHGTDTFTYTVFDGDLSDTATVTVTVTPAIRTKLTWDDDPLDLDAHLIGPSVTENGPAFHVSYESTYYNVDGTTGVSDEAGVPVQRAVFLIGDVTNGHGPEDIDINMRTPGEYLYYVHRYSTSGESLAESNAKVTVVDPSTGEELVFTVDPTSSGTYWSVFTMTIASDGGVTITSVNEYGDTAPTLLPLGTTM